MLGVTLDLTSLRTKAVNGSTPLHAGIQMLPYSLGSSLASVPAAWLIGYVQAKTGDTAGQKWIIVFGLFVSTIGFGIFLNQPSLTSFAQTSFRAALITGRYDFACITSYSPPYCWCWDRHVIPCTLSGVCQSIGLLYVGRRHQCFFFGEIHGGYGGIGETLFQV